MASPCLASMVRRCLTRRFCTSTVAADWVSLLEDRLDDEEKVEDTDSPGDPERRKKAPAAIITMTTTPPMTAAVEIPLCLASTIKRDRSLIHKVSYPDLSNGLRRI